MATARTYEVSDFRKEVIEESSSTPVLVDFWAPWCGPCRVIGPALERLAEENEGRWKLAKLNTDENPEIASRYRIQGIPAVKLFVDGKVIDEFVGALPEPQIRQWLEKALPSEISRKTAQAKELLAEGKSEDAVSVLEDVLQQDSENQEARIMLAQVLVFSDPERAEELATGSTVPQPGLFQIQEAVRTISRLLGTRGDLDMLPEGPARKNYGEAVLDLADRHFESALEHFLEVIIKDRYYDDDGARKACIAIFTLLGPQHPTTRRFRRRFDMALY